MIKVASFLRDRRGVAAIDYGMAGALATLASELAMRHGAMLGVMVRSIIG